MKENQKNQIAESMLTALEKCMENAQKSTSVFKNVVPPTLDELTLGFLEKKTAILKKNVRKAKETTNEANKRQRTSIRHPSP